MFDEPRDQPGLSSVERVVAPLAESGQKTRQVNYLVVEEALRVEVQNARKEADTKT